MENYIFLWKLLPSASFLQIAVRIIVCNLSRKEDKKGSIWMDELKNLGYLDIFRRRNYQ